MKTRVCNDIKTSLYTNLRDYFLLNRKLYKILEFKKVYFSCQFSRLLYCITIIKLEHFFVEDRNEIILIYGECGRSVMGLPLKWMPSVFLIGIHTPSHCIVL